MIFYRNTGYDVQINKWHTEVHRRLGRSREKILDVASAERIFESNFSGFILEGPSVERILGGKNVENIPESTTV